uniref:Uncharacterized protein n=1 Tax=Chaetoceros debilis TaxID=122233 RepID=A0A7S3V8X4_9STRA
MVNMLSDISLHKAYQKVSRVLMHSPQTFEAQMAQDGDPQLFELLLLEKDDTHKKMLMMSDIIPLDYYKEAKNQNDQMEHTLRPFIFNMQSHMFERASKSMENILIRIKMKSNNSQGAAAKSIPSKNSEDDNWEIKYERIATYYDERIAAPQNLRILAHQDKLDGARSTSDSERESPGFFLSSHFSM